MMNTKSLFAAAVAATLLFAGQSPANAAMGGITAAPASPAAVVHKTSNKAKEVLGLIIGGAIAHALRGSDGHRAHRRHDYDDSPRYRHRGEGRRYDSRGKSILQLLSGDRWSRRGGRHHRRSRFAGE